MNNRDVPPHNAEASDSVTHYIVAAGRRRAVWIPVLTAFLLLLFTINSGLMRDDYLHHGLLTGDETFPGVDARTLNLAQASMELFAFFTDDNELGATLKDYGNVPWWSDDELKVNFWRPVASVTHWLDFQLWPDSPALMHLQSLLWYVLVGFLLGGWLVQLGVNRYALSLVMLFYMLDASHVHAIAWLANRNILIATAFGLLSLLALTQNSHSHKHGYLLLSLLFFFISLLSAEAGISFFGIVVAMMLVLDRRSLLARFGVIASFIAVIGLWRVIYSGLGYGAMHSGFYVDPLKDTVNFLQTLFVNGPIMLYEQIVRVPSLSMLMSPHVEFQQAMISLMVLLICMAIFSPLLLKNRLATFGFFAAVISLPPACATIVSGGRLMFIFGLGVSLVLGLWFAGVRQNAPWFQQPRWYRALAWLWSAVLLAAIIVGTLAVWGTKIASSLAADQKPFNVHTDVLENVTEGQNLILLNPPVLFDQMYMPLKAYYYDMPVPTAMISMVPGYTGFSVAMQDDRTVTLSNDDGFLIANTNEWFKEGVPRSHLVYLATRVDRFFVSNHKEPDYLGSYSTQIADVDVLAVTEQGDPARIRFRFHEPLFAPDNVVLLWDWQKLQYVELDNLTRSTIPGPFQ